MSIIQARVDNRAGHHAATVTTNGTAQALAIAPKAAGQGSSVNGGELLFLALATCYCNDVYREAAKQELRVTRVEVEVQGEFGAAGEPARNVTFRARVTADASADAVRALLAHTDRVSEIQNTLRAGTAVTLTEVEVVTG